MNNEERGASYEQLAAAEILSGSQIAPAQSPELRAEHGDSGCPSGNCSGAANATLSENPYCYAIGHIEVRIPTPAIEQQYIHAARRVDTAGMTDSAATHAILSSSRFLLRHLCWVLKISDTDAYILEPRLPEDYSALLDAIAPSADPQDEQFDLVVGVIKSIASPQTCAGLTVPIVVFDQIYSFTRRELVEDAAKATEVSDKQRKSFEQTFFEVFDRLRLLADNFGNADEHRALNYLLVNSIDVYNLATQRQKEGFGFRGVEFQESRVGGLRKLVNVVFVFASRSGGYEERYRARVDVTEEFPYVDRPMSQYFAR
jgi:hypothetical protein